MGHKRISKRRTSAHARREEWAKVALTNAARRRSRRAWEVAVAFTATACTTKSIISVPTNIPEILTTTVRGTPNDTRQATAIHSFIFPSGILLPTCSTASSHRSNIDISVDRACRHPTCRPERSYHHCRARGPRNNTRNATPNVFRGSNKAHFTGPRSHWCSARRCQTVEGNCVLGSAQHPEAGSTSSNVRDRSHGAIFHSTSIFSILRFWI